MLRIRVPTPWFAVLALAMVVGCSTRSVSVVPVPASPAEFAGWDCDRIDDELDVVQQRAAELAWAVDEHSGNNILALGVGVTLCNLRHVRFLSNPTQRR